MPDGRVNNGGLRPGAGRKGYGLEQQKKRVLDQAFHTLKMSMTKEGTELKEKEKIDIARQIVLKEIGKNINLTGKIGVYDMSSLLDEINDDNEDTTKE